MREELQQCIREGLQKIVISNPRNSQCSYQKIVIRQVVDAYQIEQYTKTQVFHENVKFHELSEKIECYLESGYRQMNIWDTEWEYQILLNKKGVPNIRKNPVKEQNSIGNKMITKSHNRKKNYLIPEGTVVPPLVDMGIFTKEGMIVKSMYDKFRQINRFLEILDDEVRSFSKDRIVNIIDFGCGKSYLTFVVYYYFTMIRKQPVHIVGLDLKEKVIEDCNEAARKYGYENLHFEVGDIKGYNADFTVDIVMTLHACDTATDYALYHAIRWNTSLILSVPCCQHEVNEQIDTDQFHMLTRYGIVKERFAALFTDACRANLLHYSGYKTQILEFVDLSNTPKNLLLRARKTAIPQKDRENYLQEVEQCMKEFQVRPALYRLLIENRENCGNE